MKKHITLILIILLLLSSSFVAVSSNTRITTSSIVQEIDVSPCYIEMDASKVETLKHPSKTNLEYQESIIIHENGSHPTLAGDISGRFFAGFELSIDGTDYYPDFWYTLDDGMTWDECGYFSESLGSEYPDVDSNDNGFYGTFGGPEVDRGQIWLVNGEDLGAITASYWAFSTHGFDDFEHNSVSCHNIEDEPWDFDGFALTGYNGYQTYDVEGCPFIFYPLDDTGYATIGWLTNSEDYKHADFAIDLVTGMSYAVYDNDVDTHLLVRKINFGKRDVQGYHPNMGTWIIDDGTDYSNPSIEAHNDNVVIIAEQAGDVVCIYSNNGFSSHAKSGVATDALFPEVKVTFDGEVFVCSYIKGDALYLKISQEYGAIWTDEEQVEDSQTTGGFGSHDLGKGLRRGMYAVWEDIRGICFGSCFPIEHPPPPPDIEGGLGVTVTIENIGDAEWIDVEWRISVTGGLLSLINKTKSGVITSIGPGGKEIVKTGIIIGLGRVKIVVIIEDENWSFDGFVLGLFSYL